MHQEYKQEIEEIIDEMQCPKDFECYNSGFEVLCRAVDIQLKSYIECSERDPEGCMFSFPFGNDYLCKCLLRIYVAKKLKK